MARLVTGVEADLSPPRKEVAVPPVNRSFIEEVIEEAQQAVLDAYSKVPKDTSELHAHDTIRALNLARVTAKVAVKAIAKLNGINFKDLWEAANLTIR